ncbi:hypothetical protein KAJ27_15375 [bacterium]|nr:hypothetical protein [bacterium]
MNIRITQFNPIFRTRDDIYLIPEKDHWTCSSEIGSIINGKKFTADDYLFVEKNYVTTIISILQLFDIKTMKICNFTLFDNDNNNLENLNDQSLSETERELPKELRNLTIPMIVDNFNYKNGQIISVDQVRTVIRLVLRNVFWCQLTSSHNTYIDFSDDFYVFMGTDKPLPNKVPNIVVPTGIFVEHYVSPYFDQYEF